jgi:hypothetical protein
MPFAIRERGERGKVAEHIKTLTENDSAGKPLADQTLIESAKATVANLIASLPTEFNGVLAIAEGHSNENSRAITVQVIGEKGHF